MRVWNFKNNTLYSSQDVAPLFKVYRSCAPYNIPEIYFISCELFLAHDPLYSTQVLQLQHYKSQFNLV